MPTANDFIKDPSKHHKRPGGNPGNDFSFVQNNFNDNEWEQVNLPHDWAINGPFYEGNLPEVGGGMGRLPIQGVAWYRRKINIPSADNGKSIYLDIDGAMSYAMVWLNGNLVGGWPYGYNSFRLDLTPYIKPGGENQLRYDWIIQIILHDGILAEVFIAMYGLQKLTLCMLHNGEHLLHTRNVSASSATIDLDS